MRRSIELNLFWLNQNTHPKGEIRGNQCMLKVEKIPLSKGFENAK
jgi:hypothetical protein